MPVYVRCTGCHPVSCFFISVYAPLIYVRHVSFIVRDYPASLVIGFLRPFSPHCSGFGMFISRHYMPVPLVSMRRIFMCGMFFSYFYLHISEKCCTFAAEF